MRETWVQSLGQEDPLEKGMAIHSSILAWRISVDRGARWATVHGVTKSWTRLKRLIIFFAAKDAEALYSQQKQDQELTVVQIINSLLTNSDLN